jgi:hypothetical protein
MCCINIRNFVDQFYQFVEGVPHRRSGIDEVLRRVSPTGSLSGTTGLMKRVLLQSLDGLLISHVSKNICDKVNTMKNLSQVAQVVINVEHFVVAVDELESVLVDLKCVNPFSNCRYCGLTLIL